MTNYSNLSKKELIDLLESIKRLLEGAKEPPESSPSLAPTESSATDLENLIGTIPFLLLNQSLFEKNQDIADFANKLGVKIPSPEKKKREDIIGRVVSAIASFDVRRISELNQAIKSLKKMDFHKGKSNFFKDWENAIKQMKL